MPQRTPIGIRLIALFFAFGALACAVTIMALLFPGAAMDSVWRLNPEAHAGFQRLGAPFSILLMAAVGAACAFAAFGLAKSRSWGRPLAIVILVVNLVGDTLGALIRHDPRTLIGLPIGGAIMWYLWKARRVKGER